MSSPHLSWSFRSSMASVSSSRWDSMSAKSGTGYFVGAHQLRVLLIAGVIQIQKLADFFEAEPKSFAAQDQFQSGTVPFGKQAFLPFADWKQQFLCFIKPQRARCHFVGVAHFANCQGFGCHRLSLFDCGTIGVLDLRWKPPDRVTTLVDVDVS